MRPATSTATCAVAHQGRSRATTTPSKTAPAAHAAVAAATSSTPSQGGPGSSALSVAAGPGTSTARTAPAPSATAAARLRTTTRPACRPAAGSRGTSAAPRSGRATQAATATTATTATAAPSRSGATVRAASSQPARLPSAPSADAAASTRPSPSAPPPAGVTERRRGTVAATGSSPGMLVTAGMTRVGSIVRVGGSAHGSGRSGRPVADVSGRETGARSTRTVGSWGEGRRGTHRTPSLRSVGFAGRGADGALASSRAGRRRCDTGSLAARASHSLAALGRLRRAQC